MGVAWVRVLVQIPDGNRTLGRPRHIWKDNIKMYLYVAWGGRDLIAQALNKDSRRL